MSREIDAVIFDFGGVLSSSVGDLIAERLDGYPISIEDFLSLVLGPYDEDTDHPWHRAERGELAFVDALSEIRARAHDAGYDDLPVPPEPPDMRRRLLPAPAMIAAARRVREQGIATAILTNNFTDFVGWREVCDADELVDVVIESCRVGMRKPSPEIFQLTLDALGGVAPERTVFLDDFPWNIAGAEALGLQTIHVVDPDTAAATLLERLGL